MLVVFFLIGALGWQLPEAPPAATALRDALFAAGYFFPAIYLVYLIVGVAYLTNRFVPLATIVLVPITLNVFVYHLFLAPATLPVSGVLVVPNLLMIYACREAYMPLWQAKS